MKNQDNINNTATTTSALERIAQGIVIAHAWVAGPAMTERERIQRELVKAEAARRGSASLTS